LLGGGSGPRVGLTGFLKGEDSHEDGEKEERAVAQNGHTRERLGLGEATAVDVQAQSVGAKNAGEESADDQCDEGGPDAELPANQEKKADGNFGEGQRLGDE